MLMTVKEFQRISKSHRFFDIGRDKSPIIRQIDQILLQYSGLRHNLQTAALNELCRLCKEFTTEHLRQSKGGCHRLYGVEQLYQLASAELTLRRTNAPRWHQLRQFTKPGHLQIGEALEARDPLHRVGHGLAKYQAQWANSGAQQNFVQWMNGNAQAQNDQKLYKVAYLTDAADRKKYEITNLKGPLMQGDAGHPSSQHVFTTFNMRINTGMTCCQYHWGIWAMSRDNHIYSSDMYGGQDPTENDLAMFHHSSFLGGKPVLCAGEWKVDDQGCVVAISCKSGHYMPKPRAFVMALIRMGAMGLPLNQVAVIYFWPTFGTAGAHMYRGDLFVDRVDMGRLQPGGQPVDAANRPLPELQPEDRDRLLWLGPGDSSEKEYVSPDAMATLMKAPSTPASPKGSKRYIGVDEMNAMASPLYEKSSGL